MTNLEVLQSKVAGYPVDGNTFEAILIDRGLSALAEYSGKSKAFELAHADLYIVLLTSANITEGGFQISMTDKSNFMKFASGIYRKWDEPNPLDKEPQIIGANPW